MLGTDFRANTGKDDVSIQTAKCYGKKTKQNGKYYFSIHEDADEDYINDIAEEVNGYNPDTTLPTITLTPSGVSVVSTNISGCRIGNGIYYYYLTFTLSAYDYSTYASITSNIKPINDSIACFFIGDTFGMGQFDIIRNLQINSSGFTAEIHVQSSTTSTYRIAFIGEVV